MKVTITPSVALTLKVLGDDDRRRVTTWFDYLARWETDPHVRQISKLLPGGENIYVLRTSTDVKIFFALRDQGIEILDVTRQDSIDRVSNSLASKSA